MRYLNILWAFPATLAVAAIWCVSAYMNYSFGLSLGSDMFGYASLAVDVAKAVMLFGAFAALAHRHYLASATLTAIWVCCSLWGIASAVGFVSLHYTTMTDDRGKTAEEWTQLESQIANLTERRKAIATARPEGAVQAEIDALMRAAGSCAVINGPITRETCPKVDKLKAELANAKSAVWLDGRLDELRGELKAANRITSVDPRADMLAGILGLASPLLAKGLAGFFALMMELITATGLWAVWKAFGASVKRKEASGVSQEPRKADPVQDALQAQVDALTRVAETLKAAEKAMPAPRAPLPVTLGKLAGNPSKISSSSAHEQSKAVADSPHAKEDQDFVDAISEVFGTDSKNPSPDGGGGTQAPSPGPVDNSDTQDAEIAPENVEIKAENVYTFPVTKIEEVTKPSRLSRPQEFKKNIGKVTKNDRDALILVWAQDLGTRLPKTGAPDAGAPLATDAWRESYMPWAKQHTYPIASKQQFSKIMGEELDLGNSKAKGSKRSKKGRKLENFRYQVPSEMPIQKRARA